MSSLPAVALSKYLCSRGSIKRPLSILQRIISCDMNTITNNSVILITIHSFCTAGVNHLWGVLSFEYDGLLEYEALRCWQRDII